MINTFVSWRLKNQRNFHINANHLWKWQSPPWCNLLFDRYTEWNNEGHKRMHLSKKWGRFDQNWMIKCTYKSIYFPIYKTKFYGDGEMFKSNFSDGFSIFGIKNCTGCLQMHISSKLGGAGEIWNGHPKKKG